MCLFKLFGLVKYYIEHMGYITAHVLLDILLYFTVHVQNDIYILKRQQVNHYSAL